MSRTIGKREKRFAGMVLCALLCGLGSFSHARPTDWPSFQFDAAHTAFNGASPFRLPLQSTWTVSASTGAWSFSSAVAAEDGVYAGTVQGLVLAVDRRTGQELWRFTTDGSIHLAPAVSGGKVVLGSTDGRLYALDSTTGNLLWSFDTGSNIHASPNVVSGTVYFGSNDGFAYALDLKTGNLVWRSELGGYTLSSPVADETSVYFATLDGRIRALSRDAGALLWETSTTGQIRSSPSLGDDLVFIGSHDGTLRALRTDTGASAWSVPTSSPLLDGLAFDGQAVYAASLDGKLRAFASGTGAVLWEFDAQAEVHAGPTLVNGALALGAEDGTLHILDPSEGTPLTAVSLPGRIVAPAALSAGFVYVLTDAGVLHALRSPNLPPLAPENLLVNGRSDLATNASSLTFTWGFSDPDQDDRQTAFRLQIDSASADFISPVFDTDVQESTASIFVQAETLAEGRYRWRAQTFDLFNEIGPFSSGADFFIVDRTLPQIALNSPLGGEKFIATIDEVRVDFGVSDNLDPAPTFEAFLVQVEDRGTPRGARPTQVAVTSSTVLEPLDIDDGLWRLEVSATDHASNSTFTASGPFEIIHDTLAPRTTLALGEPRVGSAPVVVATRTPLGLLSEDDLVQIGDKAGLGVERTFFAIDSGTFSVLNASFTITEEGLRQVRYFSVDLASNTETVQTSTVAVDATAPETALDLTGSVFASETQVFIASSTAVSFAAQDPVSAGVAVGVALTEYRVDSATVPFGLFGTAFTLAEGLHTADFRSRDNVENLEVTKSTSLAVDATTPITTVAVGSPTFVSTAGARFISPATPVGFEAEDPIGAGVASGIDRIETDVDGGGFSTVTAPLTFVAGPHLVLYRALDNVANAEAMRILELVSDGTPPAISGLSPPGGERFVNDGGSITIGFTVQDLNDPIPAVSAVLVQVEDRGIPRGARPSEVTVGTGQTLDPLDLDDGLWELRISATDFVLNFASGASGAFEVVHDLLPPRTALRVGVPSFGAEPVFVTDETQLGFETVDDLVTVGDAGGLGVDRTLFAVDGSSFAVWAGSFTISQEGLRQIHFHSVDAVGNEEEVRVSTVGVDLTAPAFFDPQVGTAGSGLFAPVSAVVESETIDARITVQDSLSGLDISGSQGTPGRLESIPGTVGLWHFNEGSGSAALDSSPNGNDGTLMNMPAVSWSNDCIEGTCLEFTGTNGHVMVPNSPSLQITQAITIEAWVYWSASDPNNVGFVMGKDFEHVEIHTGGSGNENVRCIPTNRVFLDAGAGALPRNQFNHVACVYDPGQGIGKIYINGVDAEAVNHGPSPVGTPLNTDTQPLLFGARRNVSSPFVGRIDEIRILNKALSAEEIAKDASLEVNQAQSCPNNRDHFKTTWIVRGCGSCGAT